MEAPVLLLMYSISPLSPVRTPTTTVFELRPTVIHRESVHRVNFQRPINTDITSLTTEARESAATEVTTKKPSS
eukprot:6780105-Alexandrium_andersonii.AAC.1